MKSQTSVFCEKKKNFRWDDFFFFLSRRRSENFKSTRETVRLSPFTAYERLETIK